MELGERIAACRAFVSAMNAQERLIVSSQGKRIDVKVCLTPVRLSGTHERGTVNGFSRKSRLRLLKKVATIAWGKIPNALLVTLTYPDHLVDYAVDVRTMHRSWFIRDLEKYLGKKLYGIWRCEWEPRKSGLYTGMYAPHFHLLILGTRFIPYGIVNKIWRKVIGEINYVRTECKRAHNGELASVYVAKYMSKISSDCSLVNEPYLNNTGRAWGLMRASLIPFARRLTYRNLTDDQLVTLICLSACKIRHVEISSPSSFSLIGNLAEKIWEKVEGRGLTPVSMRGILPLTSAE